MMLYPAVDIRGGKCVRLFQGSYLDMTVFGEDPLEMARRWESEGAQYMHVVDLDGARGDKSDNRKIIKSMASALKIPLQVGGGIRTLEDIEEVLDMGASRVILGTSAVKDPDLVDEAVLRYGKHIAVGIDARDGLVAIEGWERVSSYTALEFAKNMEHLGVKTIIFTDISTDGTLAGPNLRAMEEMVLSVSMEVIASGGVGSVLDLLNLKRIGVQGAIIGKAIYTGAVDLKEALEGVL